MRRSILLSIAVCTIFSMGDSFGQSFTSYLTGNAEDANPTPSFGLVLMGGAGENDNAMTWFLERANGGDVVVIRATGSDGYNDYMFNDLGVNLNSVETIVFHSAEAAEDPYVIQQLQNAEAIWMAGGNQSTYISYWRNNAIEQAINDLLLVKAGAVGGTSAGMAVLGGRYYSADNGSATSAQALANPYHVNVTIGNGDFLSAPFLANTITDTHFDNPDRRGRLCAFMARIYTDYQITPTAIACDEYTAVCIGPDGVARCYGEAPQYDDNVYFVRPGCAEPMGPENCTSGNALTWNRNGEALKVYRIQATWDGSRTFNLNDWITGSGGEWINWSVEAGVFSESTGALAPDCTLTTVSETELCNDFMVYPNPTEGIIHLSADFSAGWVKLYDSKGNLVFESIQAGLTKIDLGEFPPGLYLLNSGVAFVRVIKQ